MATLLVACLLVSSLQVISSSDVDYYWKDFTGEIPSDAVLGGKDKSGNDIYIGQVVVPKSCIAVVQISRGRKEVYAPCYGVKQESKNIKVLSSTHPEKLEWIPTSNRKFHRDTTEKHLVPGGYDFDNNHGFLNIGRTVYNGSTKIGSIASYAFENARLFFPAEGAERNVQQYEVLVYGNSSEIYKDATQTISNNKSETLLL